MRFLLLLLLIPFLLLGQKILSQKHQITPLKKYTIVKLSVSPSTTPASPSAIVSEIVPTNRITPIVTSATTPTAANSNTSDFIYPGAHVLTTQDNTMLESNDDPGIITSWYKGKIKNLGWNTTSIIENTVNDNVSNQLVASNGNREVRVQISKQSNQTTVHITVGL